MQPMFVWSGETRKIIEPDVTLVSGLFKIFDEIFINAADNKQRNPTMDKFDVEIDTSSNILSVSNNGTMILIVIHREHHCYVPTLIFGHLLTGSNFDDRERKTTGGCYDCEAKLANIFSTEFVVECIDTSYKFNFQQAFSNNMTVAEDPVVHDI
jgi:DNA topoisomerase-2